MQIYIRTRGRTTDYAFLGSEPASWWWKEFRDYTSFERPTLVLASDSEGVRCIITGIPSTTRRDRVGSIIRYSLVLECGAIDQHQGKASISKLVAAFLSMVSGGTAGQLGTVLDARFDEESVEHLLNLSPEESLADLRRRLNGVLESVQCLDALPSSVGSPPAEKFWMGRLSSAKARSAFAHRVAELLNCQEQGLAAHLNLIGVPEEAETFLAGYSSAALLINDSPAIRGDDPVPIGTPSSKPKQPPTKPGMRRVAPLVLLGLMSVLAILVWLFAGGPSPAPTP